MGLLEKIKLPFLNKKVSSPFSQCTEEVVLLKKEVAILQDISRIISGTRDLRAISQSVVDNITKEFNYPGGVLFLTNQNIDGVYCYTLTANYLTKRSIKLLKKPLYEYKTSIETPENLIGKSAKEGKINISNDLYDFYKGVLNRNTCILIQRINYINSSIAIPLKTKNKIVGVLQFMLNKSMEDIPEKEKKLMTTFAEQVAIAVENVQLYNKITSQVQELQEKTEDLQALLDISKLATSSLETQSITQKILDSVPEKLGHLGYLGGILTMYDPKKKWGYVYSITESTLTQNARKLLNKPLTSYHTPIDENRNLSIAAMNTKKIQFSEKLYDFTNSSMSKITADAIQKLVGMKSGVALPLIIRNQLIGAFIFVSKKPLNKIDRRDIALLTAFVGLIDISIDNSMLYDKTVKQVNELKRAKVKLEQILNLKSEFVSIVSHQLRTPLTVIKGYISMILEGFYGPLPDKAKKPMESVYISNERLIKLVNDFLSVSRLESGKTELILEKSSLENLISSIVDEIKLEAEKKKLKLLWTPPSTHIPEITIDKEKIRQVILNLVDNAIKYTGQGFVAINASYISSKKNILIEVSDSGVGIAAEEIPKIFKSFSRGKAGTKLYTGGSGLGLYICKRFVKMHKGKIGVRSAGKEKGTTFYVELPVK